MYFWEEYGPNLEWKVVELSEEVTFVSISCWASALSDMGEENG